MNLKLQFSIQYSNNPSSFKKSFRFTVVDTDKSANYPQNFVCLLPTVNNFEKKDNVFSKIFGDKSVEQAKALLNEALKTEEEPEIISEIKRRINLLEPKGRNERK
jgi:hypothetical protein